ncbi:MAG: hypothetical protein LH615_04715 [Ferruginibacter sp.]|nr:hypothetical protein [Ferruginibacter sp.]
MYRILDWDVKRHLETVMMGLEDFITREFGERKDNKASRPSGTNKLPHPAGTPPREGNWNPAIFLKQYL